MEYWIVFRSSDGTELYRGMLTDAGAVAQQQIPPDADVLVVPQEAVETFPTNLAIVASHLCGVVDSEAETARGRFLTPGTGQAVVYLAKQQEAETLKSNPQAAAPILRAEAAALGISVSQLANQVLAAVAATNTALAAIEAARRSAKIAIMAAGNLAALKSAATVDWPST